MDYFTDAFIKDSLIQQDLYGGMSFGIISMFCFSLTEEAMEKNGCHPYSIALAEIGLSSLFEIIYGFSYSNAGSVIAKEIARSLNFSETSQTKIGNAAYSAISVLQDISPLGMARSTVYLTAKTLGYSIGLWSEKKLFAGTKRLAYSSRYFKC